MRVPCSRCGRLWTVPDPSRTFRCTACGGAVRATPAPEAETGCGDETAGGVPAEAAAAGEAAPAAEGARCPACGAAVAAGQRFCTACGAALGTTPGGSGERGAERQARRSANREFGRLRPVARMLRTLYVVLATAQGVLLILAILALAQIGALGKGVEILLVGEGVLFAIYLTGTLRVLREPFFWAILMAGLATLDLCARLLWTEGSWIPLGIRTFLTVSLWAGVAQAARLHRLMEEHPEFRLVRRRDQDKLDRSELVARMRDERRRTLPMRLALVGFALALPFLAWGLFRVVLAPPGPAATIAEFRAAWNGGTDTEVGAFFADGGSGTGAGVLYEQFRRRGWGEQRPQAGEPDVRHEEGRAAATFPLGSARLETRWGLEGRTWRLFAVELPEFEAPPLDATLERFATLWRDGSVAELASMGDAQARDWHGSCQRLLERKGWLERRPALGEPRIRSSSPFSARAAFPTTGGDVVVSFEYRAPRWWLSGLRLPDG